MLHEDDPCAIQFEGKANDGRPKQRLDEVARTRSVICATGIKAEGVRGVGEEAGRPGVRQDNRGKKASGDDGMQELKKWEAQIWGAAGEGEERCAGAVHEENEGELIDDKDGA
mmetsp:Transcript_43152/g.70059  ORF Transcript_43152/g.70059 Transcript_43152/m.70059 type:complete len:113 (+) Transcript_43152:784-1122(+)